MEKRGILFLILRDPRGQSRGSAARAGRIASLQLNWLPGGAPGGGSWSGSLKMVSQSPWLHLGTG